MTGGRRGEAMHFKTTHVPGTKICLHWRAHTPIWFASRAPVETGTYIYPTNQHTHTHSPIVGFPSQVPSMHLQNTHSHFHTSLFLPAHRNELKEEFLLCGSNGLWVLHFQSVTAVSRHFSQALLPFFSYFWRWKGEKKDKHILHFLFKVHYTASIWGGRVGEELIPRRVRENALTESYPSSNWHIHLNVCLLFLKRCRPKIIALFLSSMLSEMLLLFSTLKILWGEFTTVAPIYSAKPCVSFTKHSQYRC